MVSPRWLWLALMTAACDKTETPDLPPAELYAEPVTVAGRWHGEIAGVAGDFVVDELAPMRYRGLFAADAIERRYVLNMTHVQIAGPDGERKASNLVEFTWQDGRGDRGAGWLLVNRDSSALTGSFGRGDGSNAGAGDWTFVREGPKADPPAAIAADGQR
ncbi:MAG: hypothetical protein IPH07_12865 [Deltaproteobacteria bacterium]|nr:hypothetical protein [Deltaproteobacteria bacterium]MBK8241322.1 hypothetical protein [Deltaproteobacteria bacterium]MBK8717039.1 hypothetical protein [Deltaproteobacteria bacterium]MBP7290632.1 hypothetical protein [Nannocystaceae bacterium]